MEYTVEIYKEDRRYHKGMRLVDKFDFQDERSLAQVQRHAEKIHKTKIVKVYETYVTKRNLMNGVEFKERYDTPYYCSPSSETYWSM